MTLASDTLPTAIFAQTREPSVCFHCGEPLRIGTVFQVATATGKESVCCRGCQAVAQTILGNGLADYYRHRDRPADRPDVEARASVAQYGLYDDPEVQRSFVRRVDETTLEAALLLEGIRCAACIWLNEHHIGRLHGVISVSINYTSQRAVVRWNDRIQQLSTILSAVEEIGYRAFPFDRKLRASRARIHNKVELSRIFVAGIGMMQVMMYAIPAYLAKGDMTDDIHQLMRVTSLVLTLPVVLFSAQPIFQGAWREFSSRRLGMDTPVALGIGVAFIASLVATIAGRGEVYFDSITMFAFFLLSGRYFESQARLRGADQLENALCSLPPTATRLSDYPTTREEVSIAAVALRTGDHVLVKPGDTVPADGLIVEGSSEVNESLLSGESLPIRKVVGSKLIAGSINTLSPLIMCVEQTGPATILSTIASLAERTVGERPRIAHAADTVASYFVKALLLFVAAVGLLWLWIAPERALATVISLLVVSCPCALSLAAPAALTTGVRRLFHDGLLVTGSDAIETLARATHFVFDKTGTLTEGKMRLTSIAPLGEVSADACLAIAKALQRGSEHPIACAVQAAVESASADKTAVDLTNFPAQGIQGEIDGETYRIGRPGFVAELVPQPVKLPIAENDNQTGILLGSKSGLLARFEFRDSLRADAKAIVADIQSMGKKVILLSGDSPGPVGNVASDLDIGCALADMTPQLKLEYVRALQGKGAVVAMIGDGINDAPVLAGADVSVAMRGGTDLAKKHADILMMKSDLKGLRPGIHSAHQTMRIIKQNLAWAFVYNFTAIPLAAFGLVSPWFAALGMSMSSLLVVLNALRLSSRQNPPEMSRTPPLQGEGV